MTVTNVSTYGSLQTLLQNIGSVQGELNTAQQQISSGELSQNFQGLGSNTEQYTAFTAQMTRLTDFAQSNTTAISQMQATGNALTQITSIANNINSLISAQSSGSASSASFTQQLQSEMNALSAALNTTYGNNYLFSGTDTGTPPIKSTIPAPGEIGVPDTSYYQGSSEDTTIRIADNQTITPGVRADNSAFQNLYAGIQQALSAVSGTGSDSSALSSAETLVSQGIQGVISLEASVNANVVTVQNVNTENQSTQTYLKGLISNISSADVVSLSTQVAQDQSVLEATYSTFARISSLSLVNYLPQA